MVVEGEPGIGKTALAAPLRRPGRGLRRARGGRRRGRDHARLRRRRPAHRPRARRRAGGREGGRGRFAERLHAPAPDLLALLGAAQDTGPVLVAVDDAQWIDAGLGGRAVLRAAPAPRRPRVRAASRRVPSDRHRHELVAAAAAPGSASSGSCSAASTAARSASSPARSATPALSRAAAERLREHTGGHPLYVRALLARAAARGARERVTARCPRRTRSPRRCSPASRAPGRRRRARRRGRGRRAALHARARERRRRRSTIRSPALDAALAAGLLIAHARPRPGRDRLPAPAPARRRLRRPVPDAAARPAPRLRAPHDGSGVARAPRGGEPGHRRRAGRRAGGGRRGRGRARARPRRASSSCCSPRAWPATSTSARPRCCAPCDCLGVAGDVPRAQSLRDEVAGVPREPAAQLRPRDADRVGGPAPRGARRARRGRGAPRLRRSTRELRGPVVASLAIVSAYAGRGRARPSRGRSARCAGARRRRPSRSPRARRSAMGLALYGPAGRGGRRTRRAVAVAVVPGPFEAELMATRGGIRAWSRRPPGAVEDLGAVVAGRAAGALPRSLANAYASLADVEYRLGRWDDGLAHADIAITVARGRQPAVGAAGRARRRQRLPRRPGRVGTRRGAPRGRARRTRDGRAAAQPALHEPRRGAARRAARRLGGRCSPSRRSSAPAGRAPPSTTLGQPVWELVAEASLRLGRARRGGTACSRAGTGRPSRRPARRRGPTSGVCAASSPRRAGTRARRVPPSPMPRRRRARRAPRWWRRSSGSAHGMVLRRTRRRGAAAERLGAARERFERLGARPWLERCDAELAACGVRTAAPSASGATSALTRARAGRRRTRRRRAVEPRGGRGALPLDQGHRVPPREHLHEARRALAPPAGGAPALRAGGTCAAGRSSGAQPVPYGST